MSFSKSKRFSYSKPPTTSKEDSSMEDKKVKFTSNQRNATYVCTEEDRKISNNSAPAILSTDQSSSNSNGKTMKKIANSFTRTTTNNVFTKKQYNVRKAENKMRKDPKGSVSPNYFFTWDDFVSGLDGVKKSLEEVHTVLASEDSLAPKNNVTGSLRIIEGIVENSRAAIADHVHEFISMINHDSERMVNVFLNQMLSQNMTYLKKMQDQCQHTMDIMTSEVTRILKKKYNDSSRREEDLKRIINIVSEQLEEGKYFTRHLEDNYIALVKTAEQKILQQIQLIDSLKAELDASELTNSLESIVKKQNSK
ncbi:hypothetical protein JTB14_025926 [Gonioctena quinquepunctata]|nr:hypothetical protein JTB14_025926 [Gonioctena quinquepunctata]